APTSAVIASLSCAAISGGGLRDLPVFQADCIAAAILPAVGQSPRRADSRIPFASSRRASSSRGGGPRRALVGAATASASTPPGLGCRDLIGSAERSRPATSWPKYQTAPSSACA